MSLTQSLGRDTESVEYWDDVKVTLDFGGEVKISEISLMAYNHLSCKLAKVAFFVSDDNVKWKKVGKVANKYPAQKSVKVSAVGFSCAINQKIRYARIDVQRAKGVDRLLLGEIIVK